MMIAACPTVTAYAGHFVRSAALAILLLGLGVSATAADVFAPGESEANEVLTPVQAAGPFEFPWSLGFLPDGSMLVTERAGRLRLVAADGGLRTVSGLPPMLAITKDGQAGLLDVAVDPRFSSNGFVYLSYSHGPRDSSVLRVLRARLDAATARLDDGTIIYESTPAPVPELYGGRLIITNDGYLFLGLGDRFARERAQDLGDSAGSIVRIRTDGTVPFDNPFATMPGARPEIWSYGHRNPLGLAIDDQGRLWSHENGPSGGDELNLILPGRNYGWPIISHGVEYLNMPSNEHRGLATIEGTAREGMEQPFHAWTPAIAPSGLALEPIDGGVLFWIGGLAARSLIALEVRAGAVVNEERHLVDVLGRIRDVRRAPDGFIYVLRDGPDGILYRLEPLTEHAARRLRTRRM